MKRKFLDYIGLPLIFSAVVFAILLMTMLIVALIAVIAVVAGLIEPSVFTNGRFHLLQIIALSVIVGTIISLVISKIPLKPIRHLISAINQLASGDFTARLNYTYIPEMRKLTDSFNRMAEELGGIELLRTDFVNNFSHEFKTPIVSIKGFAEMLKLDDLTDSEKEEYLDIIISEAERLASLATNVLELTKIENQTILTEKHAFDLTEQIRRAVLMLETRWENKKINISIDMDDVTYTGNEELLNQVWLNLLDNAVKFTPHGGDIHISLKKNADAAVVVIEDSGCGISEEASRHIFDKFYKGDASHSSEGNGLGLAVAQKIVLLHRGSISCRSELDVGTEFVIVLPIL